MKQELAASQRPLGEARITEMEGLRGLLAWWVVIGHILPIAGVAPKAVPLPLRFLLSGGMAVDVFIILSGLVIFMTLDRQQHAYRPFLLRRFFRLFPAYVVCMAATLALVPIVVAQLGQVPVAGVQGIIANWKATSTHLWQHLLMHLTMLHGVLPEEILPGSSMAILAPAWSISLEWQFYLVAPAIYCAIRGNLRWLAIIGAGTVLCAWAAPMFGDAVTRGKLFTYPIPSFLPLKASFFFLGALSYYLWRDTAAYRSPAAAVRLWVVALVISGAFAHSLPVTLWVVVFGVHLLRRQNYRSRGTEAVAAVLNSPPIQWLGRISYSTYLCHGPVICAMLLFIHWVYPVWTPGKLLLLLTAGTVPLVLLCSDLLFRYIEVPFNVMAKQWATRKPKPVAEAVPAGAN